jgi:Flp pilus assembly protein TadG
VSEHGSVTLETVLVLPVVLAVLLAGFELTAVVLARVEMTAAAREGVRVAATAADPGRAVEAARAALDEPLRSAATVSVRRPAVPGRQAEVTIRVARRLETPLLDVFTVPIIVRAVMAVEP